MSDTPDRDPLTGRSTTGHEWDGIRELDTPLPKWWVYTFIATIVVAIVYCILYPAIPGLYGHTDGALGYSTRVALSRDLASAAAEQSGLRARVGAASLDDIRRIPELLAFAAAGGKAAFADNCVPCHRAGGAGAPGFPNLGDDVWLWGGKLGDIQQTITHGIRNSDPDSRQSQMPRFGLDGMLTAAQIDAVADYVPSLRKGAAAAGEGAQIFADNCAPCHGDHGQGNRDLGAPPLATKVALYGVDKATMVDVISRARNSSMPAWGPRLDPVTIKMLTVYVHALGGGE
jgi:cytochrome c oxidase cbb3-type subunit III